jgi:hypothetical protein
MHIFIYQKKMVPLREIKVQEGEIKADFLHSLYFLQLQVIV